jgi:hypothetical protein
MSTCFLGPTECKWDFRTKKNVKNFHWPRDERSESHLASFGEAETSAFAELSDVEPGAVWIAFGRLIHDPKNWHCEGLCPDVGTEQAAKFLFCCVIFCSAGLGPDRPAVRVRLGASWQASAD